MIRSSTIYKKIGRRTKFFISTLGIIAIAISFLSCRTILRYPIQKPRQDWSKEKALIEGMNPFLLSNLISNRVIFEVDWVEGCHPSQMALDGLMKSFRKYCPPDKKVDLILDDEIPRDQWEALTDEEMLEEFGHDYLDHEPSNWEEVEVIHLLYLPRSVVGKSKLVAFGDTRFFSVINRNKDFLTVLTIRIFLDEIEDEAFLWLRPPNIERTVLIHEFGHALRLVSNSEHARKNDPIHCSEPNCAMTKPGWRSIFYNLLPAFFAARIPRDYCDKCQEDISLAKKLWKEKSEKDKKFIHYLINQRKIHHLEVIAQWNQSKKHYQEAIACLREAANLSEDKVNYHNWIGWLLRSAGKHEEALESFKNAMNMRPDSFSHRNWVAHMLCNLGRYDEALEIIDQKRLLSENLAYGYFTLSRIMNGLGRYSDAADSLSEYLSAKPEIPDWLRTSLEMECASCYLRAGASDRANEIIKEIEWKSIKGVWYQLDFARLLLDSGKIKEGQKFLQGIASKVKKKTKKKFNINLMLVLAYASVLLGNEEDARKSLDRINEEYEWESSWVSHHRLRICSLIGDTEASLKELNEIKEVGYPINEDPCLEEDLANLRSEPKFKEVFPYCYAR